MAVLVRGHRFGRDSNVFSPGATIRSLPKQPRVSWPPHIDATWAGGARYTVTSEISCPGTSDAMQSDQRWFAAWSTAYASEE